MRLCLRMALPCAIGRGVGYACMMHERLLTEWGIDDEES
jgi:hypothetical protein